MIIKGSLEPLSTDKNFKDSPDAGSPECICSRCGAQIQEYEMPIRVTSVNSRGRVDKNSVEYRYCEECTTGKKFFLCSMMLEFGSCCEKQCEECSKGMV